MNAVDWTEIGIGCTISATVLGGLRFINNLESKIQVKDQHIKDLEKEVERRDREHEKEIDRKDREIENLKNRIEDKNNAILNLK